MHRSTPVLFLILAATACEQRDSLLLESTTTTVPCQGGVAMSADGRFGLRFDAETIACETQITIETVRDFEMDGLVSFVYRVGPKDLVFARDAEVSYALDGEGPAHDLRLVRVDEDRADVLVGSAVDAGGQKIRGRVRRLDKRLFAIHLNAPPSCEALACTRPCELCDAALPSCTTPSGYCDSAGVCREQIDSVCIDGGVPEGWTNPPGDGRAFVVTRIAIADGDVGFDLDGSCADGTCVDNALSRFGPLMNDQIRQLMLGGEFIVLFELAGLDIPYSGYDDSLTFKMYAGRDADDPFFPANNFKMPPGHTTCCEFMIAPSSLVGAPPSARSRAVSGVRDHHVRTRTPATLSLPLIIGLPPHPTLRLDRALVTGDLSADLSEIVDGVMGAAIPINSLASIGNPYCKVVSPRCPVLYEDPSSLLDLTTTLIRPSPDVDLDGDGLECMHDLDGDSRIDVCCDGAGLQDACTVDGCTASAVPPLDPARPWTCALRPEMADGFSIGFEFQAVAATIVGTGS